MPENFVQYLVMILIGLLFAKDYLLPPLLKKMGLGNGKNNEVKKLTENHLPHMEEKLDKLIEIGQESLFILRDLKEKNG